MKIIEAIHKIDKLLHNNYSQDDKLEWLSRLDWMVKRQLIDTHEGAESCTFTGYDSRTDLHTTLLIPMPFDEIYLRWLEAQIHYNNDENDNFNAAIIMYNTAFEAYSNYYKQTHMPLGRGKRFIF